MKRIWIALSLLLTATFAHAQKEHGFDNRKGSGQPYLSPEESLKRIKVAPEFEVKLFAAEPDCVNPVAFSIDERGRIWVLECFEYPSKTPKGKAPRDRIVILEDTDGDGKSDKRTVFAEGKDFPVTDARKKAGLGAFDLATGLEVGHGGVWLGAPPHLYFIENKDDRPGKFEILATGFGAQDTHETLNTFQWGPDGQLYGMQGIFTQSTIKPQDGPELRMNAAVWRLHPKTKKFEIFAEGTSNPWGMDWRNRDGEFILACCVIPHLYHIVPGGIYKRQAGTSYNPYAYDFIKEISDHTFHKESGWAHAGLIALDAPHIPEKYRNSVIFGSIHGCSLKQNILKPNGSSFTASRGDDFLKSDDKNFRPINLKWGPNGDIYLIDWHDQNPCHQAKPEDWDYERGRVYRIQVKDRVAKKPQNLQQTAIENLIKIAIEDPDPYRARTALRLVGDYPKAEIKAAMVRSGVDMDSHKLRLLQVIAHNGDYEYSEGDDAEAELMKITSDYSEVETAYFVRATMQAKNIKPSIVAGLANAVKNSKSKIVRREIASTALMLSDRYDVAPILRALMANADDANDPLIPNLTWLAYEKVLAKKQGAHNPAIKELAWLLEQAPTNLFVRDRIVPKAMRRLASTGQPADLELCLKFVADCTDFNTREKALDGLSLALAGQTLTPPANWPALQSELEKQPRLAGALAKLNVSFRDVNAIAAMTATVGDAAKPSEVRIEAMRRLAAGRTPADAVLIPLVRSQQDVAVRVEAARTLSASESPKLAEQLLKNWAELPRPVQAELVNVFAGRKPWAVAMMKAMDAKTVDRQLVTDNTILRIQAFNDVELNKLIEKAWGRSRTTPSELTKVIDAMRIDLGKAPGSFAKGKAVFEAQCMKCHQFEGKGQVVGPPLDGAARDIEYLLANIIDPNRVIGAPYFLRIVNTLDGKVEQGVLAEEDDRFLTLKVENGVLKKIAKADIDGDVKIVEKSMMPEGLAYAMSVQDFRDLVRYVIASPYISSTMIDGGKIKAPVDGRIALTAGKQVRIDAEFTAEVGFPTQLLLGAVGPYEVLLDDAKIGAGNASADLVALPAAITAGKHKLTVILKKPGEFATMRFLDPDRRLSYPE